MKTLLLLFVFAALCCDAASVFYVDPVNGSDSNAGTSTGAAWKTIPGTRTTNDSGFVNSGVWGSITTSARIQDNTTINLRPLYTFSGTNGGYIWLSGASGHLYNFGYTNLVFQADQTWGTGKSVIDGTGCVITIGLFLCQIDGVTFRNLDIRNSDISGIQLKEKAGSGDAVTNITVDSCDFSNNGKSHLSDAAGAGDGQLNVRRCVNLLVTNCLFNGNQVFVNGIIFGDSHKSVSGFVLNSISTNHQGDIVNNDAGIGFKSLNSTITFSNCTSAWNLKGWDCGEVNADAGFTNKVVSCSASNNYWGMNANGVGASSTLSVNFYFINNLVVSNAYKGMHIYAPPFTAAVVHNIFDYNGQGGGLYNGSQLSITPESTSDTNVAAAYSYNNIFQNSFTNVLENNISHPTNRFTWLSDYNSYKQAGSERFCLWSLSYGPSQVFFTFGANGPGHASGNWYSWYAQDTTPPLYGTGHFHSDSHSKGTSCDDTNLPALSGYQLQGIFPMRNLSLESWYISEMGIDRNGVPRTSWDVGPAEFPLVPLTASGGGFKGLRFRP